jgi:hypothetical protein
MSQTLTLRLADGTEIQGEVEGSLSSRALDLLNAAGSTNLRLVAEKPDADVETDTEGHGVTRSIQVRISDDVEGHAFSIRLPDATAARDVQARLLAGGALVGVIVVGAAVAQTGVPDLSIGAAAPGSAPAPVTRAADWDQAHAAGRAGAFSATITNPAGDVGIMDASGNAIAQDAGAPARGVNDDIGIMDASSAAAAGSSVAERPATWDQAHRPTTSGGAVIGGAVHPGETRTDLRTDAPAAENTGESAKRAPGSGSMVDDVEASNESAHPPMPGEPNAR